jgi:hypothetical protein
MAQRRRLPGSLERACAKCNAQIAYCGYRTYIFGFDSDMSEVVNYAKSVNARMKNGGHRLDAAA